MNIARIAANRPGVNQEAASRSLADWTSIRESPLMRNGASQKITATQE
jgi:hypothetical protein